MKAYKDTTFCSDRECRNLECCSLLTPEVVKGAEESGLSLNIFHFENCKEKVERKLKIEGRRLSYSIHYLAKVTYVPVEGNAGHEDCEQGVIVGFTDHHVKVLYSKTRCIQLTDPDCLVFG